MLRHARGQGGIHFSCSADREQDWQPYPVAPYFVIYDDHTYTHTCTQWGVYTYLAEVEVYPEGLLTKRGGL